MTNVIINRSGIATVSFINGEQFDIQTNIYPRSVGGRSWHDHSVYALVPTQLAYVNQPLGGRITTSKLMFECNDVWMGLKDYPALEFFDEEETFEEEFGSRVSTGDVTEVDIFGPVSHIVNEEKKILVNATLPSHTLHEGYVARHVICEAPHIVAVQSIGFGTGDYRTINNLGARSVWGGNSIIAISAMASEYYARRTGNHSIYYRSDPEFSKIPLIERPTLTNPVFIAGSAF